MIRLLMRRTFVPPLIGVFAVFATLSAAVAPRAQAQTITGHTVDIGGHPLPGVIVLLVAPNDSSSAMSGALSRTLSDPSGAFTLTAPTPGRYALRTLRIGFRPQLTAPFDIAAGERITKDVAIANIPVRLETVRVTAEQQCRTGDAGRPALDAWNEAKKALLASVLTRQTQLTSATILLFEQSLDPRSRAVRAQSVQTQSGPSGRPFGAARTPEEFARLGYSEPGIGTTTFDAPDEITLLSDSFGATHCLRLVPDDSANIVAVEFQPVSQRAGVVDVAGTLRLDRATAELRSLDFHYTNVDNVFNATHSGGRLDFVRLPQGAWLVREWRLTLPMVTQVNHTFRAPTYDLTSLHVNGGLLVEARDSDAVIWRAKLADVEGYVGVGDSSVAVQGANVSLDGTDYRATTDALGTFVIPDVFPGHYRVGVQWAPLDSMGIVAATRSELTVPDSGSATLRLAVPTLEQGLAIVCGKKSAARGEGLVRGRVAPSATKGSAGLRVYAAWHQVAQQDSNTVVREGEKSAKTDDFGRFSICGVPRGVSLTLRIDKRATGSTVTVPVARPFTWVDLARPDSLP